MDLNEQLASFIQPDIEDQEGLPIQEAEVTDVTPMYYAESSAPDVIQGLLTLNDPAEASIDQILAASSYQEDISRTSRDQAVNILQALRSEQADVKSTETSDFMTVAMIDAMSGGKTQVSIGTNEEGRRQIALTGSPDQAEFQGLGKYASPEEFMRANPEGFKKTNPVLWERMQADAKARAEAPTLLAQKMGNELNAKMAAIQNEPDPLKKEMMLSEMKASVAMAAADMTKQMRVLAEDKAGIKKIESLYNQSLQADIRAGGKESVATKNYRMQLAQAQQNVKSFTKQLIAENPTLASLSERVKGFLTTQERLVGTELRNLDINQQKIQAEAETLSPEAIKRLTYLQPDIQNNAQKAAAYVLNKSKLMDAKTRQAMRMITDAPDVKDLIPMALTNNVGSPQAREIVIQAQMERTGQTREEVMKEMKNYASIMASPQAFESAIAALPKTEENKKLKAEHALMMQSKGKEAQAAVMEMRAKVAHEYMKTNKANELLGNVWNWAGLRNDEELRQAYDKAKTVTGKASVSIDDLISSYVSTAPKELSAARLDKIKAIAMSEAMKYQDPVFGGVDLIRYKHTIQAKGALTASAGNFIDSLDIGKILPQNMMGGFPAP